MAPSTETYRRLPGRRRGIFSSASMWMGSDHLLLVKSAWYREDYKRFYLRDIQAIVVAPCARYHFSMPMLIAAVAWLIVGAAIGFSFGVWIVWVIATLAMAATWLSVSIASSCRCRLYTAVSKDDLPSLYRTWTARKFLRQVQPLIERVQGTVDPGWIEQERANVPAVDLPPAPKVPSNPQARSHTLASDLFVLSLFVGSIVDILTVRSRGAIWPKVNTSLTLLQLAGAISVLVQYFRGNLQRAMQRLAIAALVLIGVMFYIQAITFSFASAWQSTAPKSAAVSLPPWVATVHQVADGLGILLGFLGAAIILRGSMRDEPDIIKD